MGDAEDTRLGATVSRRYKKVATLNNSWQMTDEVSKENLIP